jgi:hypothetical protein
VQVGQNTRTASPFAGLHGPAEPALNRVSCVAPLARLDRILATPRMEIMPIDNKDVEAYIADLAEPHRTICTRLRSMIRDNFPSIDESWGWSRPLYGNESGYVAYMVANKNNVNFGFDYGARLEDPKELLRGTGKNKRHVKISDPDDLDLDYLQNLLFQAMKLDSSV